MKISKSKWDLIKQTDKYTLNFHIQCSVMYTCILRKVERVILVIRKFIHLKIFLYQIINIHMELFYYGADKCYFVI